MRSTPLSIVAIIGLGVSLSFAAIAVPANAAPVNGAMSKNLASVNLDESRSLTEVQYRRGHRGRGGHGRHGRNHRRGDSSHRRGDNGAGVAAGVLGGLFLGSIIANQGQQQRSVEYCSQRYRSYDPRSGTYMGYDGRRHACP